MAYLRSSNAGDVTRPWPPSSALSHRNIIINGGMTIAQRGTSISSVGIDTYTLDRWKQFAFTGAENGRSTVTQESITDLAGFSKALKMTVTTTSSSLGGTHGYGLQTRLELNTMQHFEIGTAYSKPLVASFYAKAGTGGSSGAVGTYTFHLAVSGGGYYLKEFTITTSWQRFEIPIPVTVDSNMKTTTTALNLGALYMGFGLSIGSSGTDGVHGVWTDGGKWATSNQSDFYDNSGNELYITGCQLELGTVATPFEHRSFEDELQKCMRYYEKSFDYATAVGTATDAGSMMFMANRNPGSPHQALRLKTEKRAVPTYVVHNSAVTDETGTFRNVDASNNPAATVSRHGASGATVYSGTSATLGQFIQYHYTATAEL